MHRERKKDIVVLLSAGLVAIPFAYIFFGWVMVLLYLGIMWVAYRFMPPEELYVKMDVMQAKLEILKKLEGIQTTITEYMDEKERMVG